MLVFKLLRVALHLGRGLCICALVFPWLDEAGRALRIKRWSAKLLTIYGIQVEVKNLGRDAVSHVVVVANHVSWLDIFVINSLQPCRFVAKSDIRDWPLIGWLCDKAGTVFIARGKLRAVRKIYQGLVACIQAGQRVAFFPEGTTAAQGGLQDFHANLFEAAIDAKVPIQPYALRYLDAKGDLHPAVNFIGDMSFAQSTLCILKADAIKAELILLPIIVTDHAGHRRELANTAHHAIAAALGYSGH